MAKGYNGESCAEVVCAVIVQLRRADARTIFDAVRQRGKWEEDGIWQNLMSCVDNLPSAYIRWPTKEKCLLLREDGTYEAYEPSVHGQYLLGQRTP